MNLLASDKSVVGISVTHIKTIDTCANHVTLSSDTL